MKREDLFEAIGEADPDLVADSHRTILHWKRYLGAAAACLVLVGSLALWKGAPHAPLGEPSVESPNANHSSVSAPALDASNLEIPSIEFKTPETVSQTMYDIALPEGHFFCDMTPQDMGSLFGLEALDSIGQYAITGQVIYDGNGDPWAVNLYNVGEETTFHVELAPGHLPYECVVVEAEDFAMDYNGTALSALVIGDRYQLSGLYEGTETVGFRAESSDKAALEELAQLAFGRDTGLRLSQLHTDDIPQWRCEQLEEAAARAEEGFGQFLPTNIPERFTFSMAYRELGQNRDYLILDYETSGIYGYLSISVEKVYGELPMIDPDLPETYDRSDYDHGGEPIPEAYYDTWSQGVFRQEDVTPERVAARCCIDPEGAKSCDLRVLYPDGTLVSIYGGITAQEAYDLISQIG